MTLAGVWWFETTAFGWVLFLAGLAHLLITLRYDARITPRFIGLHFAMVLIAVGSVWAHVRFWVGPADGVATTVGEFLARSWSVSTAYVELARYTLIFIGLVVAATLVLSIVKWIPRRARGAELLLLSLYAASAVNVACHYAWQQPLRNIGVSPDAKSILFAAGLLGLEFALLVYAMMLVLAGAWHLRFRQRTSAPAAAILDSSTGEPTS